ncbi:MAG: DUF2254 domain-containing protein [Terriglobia bacterium]|nr:DUF2254 domain-containing protein [Terriglobia bacterium]
MIAFNSFFPKFRDVSSKFRIAQIRTWLIPVSYVVAAIVAGFTVPRFTSIFLPELVSSISTSAAMSIYSAIASGMIALTGIVFSLAFLMVQFSATVYSPRLVLLMARDSLISHALGIFTATFFYALTALAWVDRSNSGGVSLISLGVVVALLLASIAMFIALINRIGMLQVNRILIFIGDKGREIIGELYPPITHHPELGVREVQRIQGSQVVLYHGSPRFVQAIRLSTLEQLATHYDCVIELMAAVGDSVLESTPIMQVRDGKEMLPREDLMRALVLGDERTFEQDPKYALRLLVDIAIRALSPAINDPTTAVQALDQIEDLLTRLGRRRLEIGIFHDNEGKVRVMIPFPSWEDFLRVAFDEIRFYGSSSVQVMRRMKAVFSEMMAVLPHERHAALRYWQDRLKTTIDQSFSDSQDRFVASMEDRQGLGIPRQGTDEDVCVPPVLRS